VFKNNQDKV